MSTSAVAEPKSVKPTAEPIVPADGHTLSWVDPHRRFENKWWRIKRSRYVDRTRLDGIEKRIELYNRLRNVLTITNAEQASGTDVAHMKCAGLNVEQILDSIESPSSEQTACPTHVPTDLSKCSVQFSASSPVLDGSRKSIEHSVASKHRFGFSDPERETSIECPVSAVDSATEIQLISKMSVNPEGDLVDGSTSSGHFSLGVSPTTLEPHKRKELSSSFITVESETYSQKLEPTSMLEAELNTLGAKGLIISNGMKKHSQPPLEGSSIRNYGNFMGSGHPNNNGHSSKYAFEERILAAEFNASLGDRMTQFRQEIADVLSEHPEGILFPLELMIDYHSRFGRRICSCVQEFSVERLYAWLRCSSSLDLSRLIT
ncbi:hypothetical protein BIW11_13224 [Tropilaelaps mercedesae]|uniref:Uncharacterized protein n=1 Tax=Tropilaelaps mercedesae TaxID=418985 RepID=A0A1V9X2X7_9ACAR|nr:hypothetical protein BIW11_13224 [Tropilaelaps mercedesae]